jgi:type III secretion protein Q
MRKHGAGKAHPPSSPTADGPIAGRLPRWTPGAARAARLLHDRRLLAAWRARDAGIDIVALHEAPAEPIHRLRLESDLGGFELLLCAPRAFGSDTTPPGAMALAATLAEHGTDGLSPALQQLAAEALFGPALEGLRALGLAGLAASALGPAPPAAAEAIGGPWCALRGESGERLRFALGELPARAADALCDALRGLAGPPALRGALALRGSAVLSSRRVARAVLASLAPGDVLLLPGAGDAPDGASAPAPASHGCEVRFGVPGRCQWRADAFVGERSITLQGAPRMSDDAREEDKGDQDDAAAADGGIGLEQLDILVRFEIETVAVPLSALEAMAPGAVIELATPLASARLRLVACGRVIGEADLVAVGDRLGARITRMGASDADRRA